jgi:hypothetical protein
MALVNYNLDIIQGSTFSAQLIAKNADGTAVNLTDYSVRGVMKYNYGTGVSLLNLNPSVNTTSPNTAASGVIDVSISAAAASALPVTVGVYDIEMYNNNETEVKKLLDGRIKVYPEVTNI